MDHVEGVSGIKIKNIREVRWEFCDVLYLEDMEFDIKKFVSDINFDSTVDPQDSVVKMFFHSRYGVHLKEESNDDKKALILHSDIEIEFQVRDLPDVIKEDNGEVFKDLLATLLGITISTARGIIYSNTKGHMVNKLILPIVNPHQLIEKKIERGKSNKLKENQ